MQGSGEAEPNPLEILLGRIWQKKAGTEMQRGMGSKKQSFSKTPSYYSKAQAGELLRCSHTDCIICSRPVSCKMTNTDTWSLLIQKAHSLQMTVQSRIISLTQIHPHKCADYSLSIFRQGLQDSSMCASAEWTCSVSPHSVSQEWIRLLGTHVWLLNIK